MAYRFLHIDMNKSRLSLSSDKNILILCTLIITSEIICHFIVALIFPQQTLIVRAFIDGILLILIVIPSLYFFVYKPKIVMLNELLATKKSNEKLNSIIANSSIMLFNLRVMNEPKVATEWASDNVEKILGYSIAEVHVPEWWFSNIHPQNQSEIITKSSMLIQGHQNHLTYEYRFRHKNGEYIWIHDEQKLEFDGQGKLTNILCIWKDITDKKIVELELTIAAHTFESHQGIMITDADMRILKVNPTFEKITGHNLNDVVGHTPSILKSGKQDADFYHDMWTTINHDHFWQGEIWNQRKSGEIYAEQLTISVIKDHNESVTNYIGIFNDITERKVQEEQINLAAYYDLLTSLPNRRLALDRLEHLRTANNRSKEYAALIFLDMDRFKILNDTYGHDIGDKFLIEIAIRLKSCVRENDTISRFGGDEFVIVLSGLSTEITEATTQTHHVAEKIRLLLATPYILISTVNGQKKSIQHISSASIGIVMFPDNEMNVDDLLKRADLAMYESKSFGGDSICVFNPTASIALPETVLFYSDPVTTHV